MEVDPKALAQAVAAELDAPKISEADIVFEPIRAALMDLSVEISTQTNGRVLLTENYRWSDSKPG